LRASLRTAVAIVAFCGVPQANRNDFYFFRKAGLPEAASTNQSWDYSGGLQCEVAHRPALAVRSAAQLAAHLCPSQPHWPPLRNVLR